VIVGSLPARRRLIVATSCKLINSVSAGSIRVVARWRLCIKCGRCGALAVDAAGSPGERWWWNTLGIMVGVR
jgi:hypothetical protein